MLCLGPKLGHRLIQLFEVGALPSGPDVEYAIPVIVTMVCTLISVPRRQHIARGLRLQTATGESKRRVLFEWGAVWGGCVRA
jgi:hypothetical protein